MWGDITGKAITEMEDSFCFGESCLIITYGQEARRTIAYKGRENLAKAHTIIDNAKDYTIEVREASLVATKNEVETIVDTVNPTHAHRFEEVLLNLQK